MKCNECGDPRTKKVRKPVIIETGERVGSHRSLSRSLVCPRGHRYEMED